VCNSVGAGVDSCTGSDTGVGGEVCNSEAAFEKSPLTVIVLIASQLPE
jgi:hypothetical protein